MRAAEASAVLRGLAAARRMRLMSQRTLRRKFLTSMILAGLVALGVPMVAAPPAEPVKIDVAVGQEPIEPGSTAQVTVRVLPASGIKVNRYPKIQVTVREVDGLVGASAASLGNPKPPPVDNPESNYFKEPEPVQLELHVSADAPSGTQDVDAEVKYFYCVAASGYCAPGRSQFKIPVSVR